MSGHNEERVTKQYTPINSVYVESGRFSIYEGDDVDCYDVVCKCKPMSHLDPYSMGLVGSVEREGDHYVVHIEGSRSLFYASDAETAMDFALEAMPELLGPNMNMLGDLVASPIRISSAVRRMAQGYGLVTDPADLPKPKKEVKEVKGDEEPGEISTSSEPPRLAPRVPRKKPGRRVSSQMVDELPAE